MTVENTSGLKRAEGPVTFGMVFAKGDVPGTVEVEGLKTQVDAKRHWPDGFLKRATNKDVAAAQAAAFRDAVWGDLG